ncbi:MAG TPA: TonB-dependent receptor [Flavisolibacter sp.]|nr:TonB-dependent receptor [Flavisolibacter sp.]
MYKIRVLLCLSSFLQLHLFSSAQTETTDLDPVTVTSSISAVTSSKTGRNIFVIRGDRFRTLPVNSVDELLRYLPGIEVQARGPMGVQSDIIIRGGTFQQVLVILDGIRLNDPITGHFNSYIPIAPAEIERIEILKGASSAIYGSEAVGGVVQVITKSFAAKKGAEKKSASAQVSAGQYNLLNAQAGGFCSDGKTTVGGGLLKNNTDGQPQRGTNGYYNLHTASLSVSHFINDKLKLSLRSSYDDRAFSAQNFYTTFISDTATERVKSNWNHFNLSYQTTKNKLSIDAGLKTADDTYAFNSRAVANLNKSKLWQVLLQNEHRFNTKTSVNTGVQFINRSIRSNDRGVHNEAQAAAFALLNYNALSGFNLSPALRVDWNEQRGAEVVPQLAMSYRLSKILFRGSAGKTIRDADFTERYNNYNKALVTSGRIGNPDLQAETSTSYEAGVDYYLSSNIKFSGTFFQRFHEDLIDYVPTPYAQMPRRQNLSPTGTYALAANVAEVDITGGEIDIQYTYTLGTKSSLWGSIGAVWLNASGSQSASAFYLSSFAKFLTNFNAMLSTPRFNLSVNGVYKQREPQTSVPIKAILSKSYFTLNGKAEVMVYKNKMGLFIQADNIFNERYSDLLGSQMPGRWLMFGGKFTL